MNYTRHSRARLLLLETVFILASSTLPLAAAKASTPANIKPVADAGLPRYAAAEPVHLDGSRSYDPDLSGPLTHSWIQVSGPPLVLSEAQTARPTVSGFTQTDEIQECEFELIVSDGELLSRADRVRIVIVPSFGTNTLTLENPPFDPNKPTFLYFGGGNCSTGSGQIGLVNWGAACNIIDFRNGYEPDNDSSPRTYYHCGDMLIAFLSSVAPNYAQPIQTSGWSTGGQPAIDVALRLNLTYNDARYAANQVTFLDAACRVYSESILSLLAHSVDGERCWIDNYVSQQASFHPEILNVGFSTSDHSLAPSWYLSSLDNPSSSMNQFNHGIVAGAYWSVVGPGKNLQLASTPGLYTYWFNWTGSSASGSMTCYDGNDYPGRLPEPVTLLGPPEGASIDVNGVVLSCQESENAVGYQLLFGADPYHMVYLFSDTPFPPSESVATFPFERTWWTIRAYDQYGSTIHADPLEIHAEVVTAQAIENAMTGQTYASVQQAINDAQLGDEIVLSPGACQYLESVTLKGKNLTIRSTDPDDPAAVAATVINGDQHVSVIDLSDSQGAGCVIDGLTLIGGSIGISCCGASPTIRNCMIGSNSPNSIEFWEGYEPTILNCDLVGGQAVAIDDPRIIAYWKLDEMEGDVAYDSVGTKHAAVFGDPAWHPDGGMVDGALQCDGIDDHVETPFPFMLNLATYSPFSIFAWIQGGAPGQAVISQRQGVNWLMAGPLDGTLMTELRAAGRLAQNLDCPVVITDGNWHRVGLVWDGINRTLYVDDVQVATDTQPNLPGSAGGLYLGCGKDATAGTFFTGLIDDVRIYNSAVKP